MSYRALKRNARRNKPNGSRNISSSRKQENGEVLVVPLPKGVEAMAPMLLLPTPDNVAPEHALTIVIEALKLAAETAGEHRADMTVLQHQLERYGNKLVLPLNGRMVASAGFFAPMLRQMEQDCPLCRDGTHTHGTHDHEPPTHGADGKDDIPGEPNRGGRILPMPDFSDSYMIEIGNAEEIKHYGAVVGIDWAQQVARSFLGAGYPRARITNLATDDVVADLDAP